MFEKLCRKLEIGTKWYFNKYDFKWIGTRLIGPFEHVTVQAILISQKICYITVVDECGHQSMLEAEDFFTNFGKEKLTYDPYYDAGRIKV